jgi:predicted metal-dependent phosphoesterase TrpH
VTNSRTGGSAGEVTFAEVTGDTVGAVTPAATRHPHLAAPRRSGHVRVDLHSHTMWSGDSTTTVAELERAVADSGIDVLCITDHNAIAGAVELRDRLPCRVVVGEELRTSAGELIGLFLSERIPMGVTPVEAATAIREQGGIVYVPHPFDPMRRNLAEAALLDLVDRGLVDAIEVLNAKTSLSSLNARATTFAVSHGLAHGAGSDAHVPDAIGAAFVEVPDFDGPASLLDALRSGHVVGHHWDEPRAWSPRIVPSLRATDG